METGLNYVELSVLAEEFFAPGYKALCINCCVLLYNSIPYKLSLSFVVNNYLKKVILMKQLQYKGMMLKN